MTSRAYRPLTALVLLALLALVPRLLAFGRIGPADLTPDGARFLEVARAFGRGQGVSTLEGWPAWMDPAALPMPETFKEPGYAVAIAALAPLGDPESAARWISLLAGMALPFAVFALGRRLVPDPRVAWAGALFAAASPVLVRQSALVMAESLAALPLVAAFVAAAPGTAPASGGRRALEAGVAGACLGLSFLVRAQALVAAPALLALLLFAGPWRARARAGHVAAAAAGGLVAIAPWVARNLAIFGAPLHSDVAAFGLWPYVDTYAFTHTLARPPAPLAFTLAHPAAIARQWLASAALFARHTLPRELLGHALGLVPLATGVVLALRRPRTWGFAPLAVLLTAAFLFGLNWIARYFASAAPLLALLAGLGAVALRDAAGDRRLPGRVPARGLLDLAVAGVLLAGAAHGVRSVVPGFSPEGAAARATAPFLRAHLAPGEAVMAEVTSYWAWYVDRPVVHPVVADPATLARTLRRLHVRWAALGDSALAGYASHSPGGRLPAALVFDHAERAAGVSLYRVEPR